MTPTPYHRQFFTTIRRQIWQIFDTSPPKQCRRLKWMVPKMMMQNIASKSSLALSMYLDSWWINTFLENNQVRIQVRIKPDIFLRFSYPEHLSRFKPENHLLNAARSLSSNLILTWHFWWIFFSNRLKSGKISRFHLTVPLSRYRLIPKLSQWPYYNCSSENIDVAFAKPVYLYINEAH